MFRFLSGCCRSVERLARPGAGLSVCLCKCMNDNSLAVITVPMRYFAEGGTVEDLHSLEEDLRQEGVQDSLLLYEDRWCGSGPLVRSMLHVRTGQGMRVFARNCEVRTVNAEVAAAFLDRNHVYGNARSACRLGLFRVRATGSGETGMDSTPQLVAVASFSAGRRMESGVLSYEWIRYASLREVCVTGGMGKLLEAFACRTGGEGNTLPFEVMTYSDEEWYDGRSYRRLGFEEAGYRPPVAFLCAPDGSRIHEGKFSNDRKYRSLAGNEERMGEMVRIFNPGSRRYVRRFGMRP